MTDDEDFELFDPDRFCCFEQIADEKVPDGFTSVAINMDLRPTASLSWPQDLGQKLISQGYKIVFDLNFGFEQFYHQSHLSSCQFALEQFLHFIEPIQEHVIGVIFAKVHLPQSSAWNQMFFDYINKLYLPANLTRFLLVKADSDPVAFCNWMHTEALQGFTLGIQSSPYCLDTITWQNGPRQSGFIGRSLIHKCEPPKIALLAPTTGITLESFQAMPGTYKVIQENELTHAWNGIDELFVPNSDYSQSTQRALDGFCAAGGILTRIS